MTDLEERILDRGLYRKFQGGGSTKKCDYGCDQALKKAARDL